MNFSTDDDDGDFGFSAGPGSKLSSLFGMDKTSNQGGNESLTFTAPKQPKKTKDQQQQQQSQQTQGQGGQSALLLAVAVHAYRFSNGTYIKHGKLGAAILGNHTANDYKILLYISKQQQVTHARISPTFAFTVQANNYATFYDEQRQNWSIMFESEQNAIDFAKQVGLAKVNSAGSAAKSLVFQDLTIGLGDAVQSGDSVEVKYTGWLYSSRSFGDVFDSNTSVDKPFRFKIGKGKVIKGWEEGVVGMKKNGRRLLIVPPPLAYGKKGLGSRIPPNSTLLFDVEIKKLKFSRDKEESGSLSSDATDGLRSEERVGSPKVGRSRGGDVSSDNESRIKHNNNSESLLSTSPSSSKAKLISRMAKMGQPMLPLAGGVVAQDSTDSEADEASASDTGGMSPSGHPNMMAKKAMKVPKKMHNNHTNNFQSDMGHGMHNQLPRPGDPGVHQVAIYNPQSAHNQSQPMPPGQGHMGHQAQAGGMGMQHGQQPLPNYPLHQQQQQQSQQQHTYYQPPQHIPSQNQGQNPMQHQMAPYPNMANQQALVTQQQMTDMQMVPIVLSEARQHHSDIRSAVGKVSDRIDDLCKKVNDIQPTPSQPALPSNQAMEATVLMSNISRIVQENERLKEEVYDKNTRIEKQNNKISELLQKNQLYVEQSNSLMEKTNDSFKLTATQSQQRVLELEQEKVQMTSELTNATSKISSLQMELSNVQQREGQLRAQLNGAINNKHENLGELDQLRQQLKENDNKYTEVLKALKDERQLKKQLENKVTTMEEELSEMKMERDSIEKNLLERKRKAAAEKQKSEEDIDDLKRSFEDEILQLKSKIRHQKTSTDAATAEQVSQVERELETQWRERSDRLLLQAKEKHEREMEDARDEKEQLKRKLAATEAKMLNVRANDDNKEEVEGLQKQVQEMEVWKEKYDSLHSSAVSMKERYETRIKELIQEKAAAAASSATIAPAPTNIVDEVKKVMNNVYHSLRGEIDTSENYKGNEVLNIIMNTIKMMMIKVMKEAAKKADQEEGDDEEESEEEEEEEEEEEDDDEEEEEEEVPVKAPVKETVAKKENAVPVMAAPPSGSPAPPAVQSTSPPPPTIVIEEVVQREDEQVVESARQPEEEEVNEEEEEEEEEEQKREEEKDETASSDVAPVAISTEPTKVVVDQGEQVQDEEKEEEEKKEEDDTDGGLGDSTMVADNNANDQQEEEEEEEQDEEREEEDDADDEESLKDSKKEEDDDFWSAEGSDAEEEVEKPTVVEPSGPPKIPPELPPQLPSAQEDDACYLDTGDKPRALSNIPDLPGDLDVGAGEKQEEKEEEDDEEADPFAPPEPSPAEEEPEDDDDQEEEEEEEEKSADTGPLPTVLDREPPELPPELPAEDEEDTSKKTKTKKEDISSGIFGDEDDDDGLFSIPVSSTKKAAKKKPTPVKTTVKPAEEDDPFKPGPPPPLFGDDDDDDLDWIS